MKQHILMKIGQGVLLLMAVTAGVGIPMFVAGPPLEDWPEAATQAVKGEVVMIESNLAVAENASGAKTLYMVIDQLYVAKDMGDEAVQFHVNRRTQMEDHIEVGDKVE